MPEWFNNRKGWQATTHTVVMFAILYGLAWASTSTLTFFSSDTGLRFLQVRELTNNHFSSLAIDYPARMLDPELQYTPYYYAYSVIRGALFLQISAFLPLFTAWLYAAIGNLALPIIPVVSAILTAVAVCRLGRLAELEHTYLLLWATVFATPLFFYSLELWDHTLTTAATSWAVVGLAYSWRRGNWALAFGAGIALGFGIGQRPEAYVFAIAVGLAWLLLTWGDKHYFLALITGTTVIVVPIWLLNWQWTGHPLGMAIAPHLFQYGVPTNPAYSGPTYPRFVTLMRFILYVQGQDGITFIAALCIISGILQISFFLRVPRFQKGLVMWWAFGVLLLGNLLMIWRNFGQPIPGVLSTFPLTALSFAYVGREEDHTEARNLYLLVLLTALMFLGLMIAFWPSSGGIQWGARYLLPVYPLLLFLAFYVFSIHSHLLVGALRSTFQQVALGLLVVSALLQIVGAGVIYQNHHEQAWIRDAIGNLPVQVIITNDPFLPSLMASLADKQFMYIDSQEDLEAIIPRMVVHSIDHFALITQESMPIVVPKQIGPIVIRQTTPLIYELFYELDSGKNP